MRSEWNNAPTLPSSRLGLTGDSCIRSLRSTRPVERRWGPRRLSAVASGPSYQGDPRLPRRRLRRCCRTQSSSPSMTLCNSKHRSVSFGASGGRLGFCRIPLPGPGEPRPGFIVDGQQRTSALSELPPDRHFPVVIVGSVTDSPQLQRDQFVLVNKTKPLPRDLLNELMPHISASLPTAWRVRRVAATVLEHLRFNADSPFVGRIKGIGPPAGPGANISQAAVLAVIEYSIRRNGVLTRVLLPRVRRL